MRIAQMRHVILDWTGGGPFFFPSSILPLSSHMCLGSLQAFFPSPTPAPHVPPFPDFVPGLRSGAGTSQLPCHRLARAQ